MFPFGVTLSRSEGSPSFGKEAAITNKKRGAQALSPAPPSVHLLWSYASAHVSISGIVIKEDSDDLPYAIGMWQKSIAIIIVEVECSRVTVVVL
jgi:hypothetical protein